MPEDGSGGEDGPGAGEVWQGCEQEQFERRSFVSPPAGSVHRNGSAGNHLLERVEEALPSSFLFSKRSTMSSCAGFSPYDRKTSKPTRLAAVTGASFR
jgi:hypothetical protein